MGEAEKSYLSFEWALYITVGFEVFSAIFFLLSTWFVPKDWEKAEKEEMGEKQLEMNRIRDPHRLFLQLSRPCRPRKIFNIVIERIFRKYSIKKHGKCKTLEL